MPPRRQPVNYDAQNEDDDDGAIQNARDCRLPFNKDNVKLWFSLIESRMQFAGLKKQWSKRQVPVQLIPPELHTDFQHYLQLQEDEAGEDAYLQFKKAIIKRFGPKRADNFDKAISRVMTSNPSHLGHQILNDICPETRPLQDCHCADVVLGIWRRSLPSVVRNAIADMDFSAATYTAVFDRADNVWASNSASTTVVATLNKNSKNQAAEVAAVGGKKNKKNKNKGGGADNSKPKGKDRGPRHPDNPPSSCCDIHYKFGKKAWFCADRHSCPWRDYESPKPKHNRNIVAAAEVEEDSD